MFSQIPRPTLGNDAALMLARSDDDGETWNEPIPLYAYPGWFCMAMGGLARISDDHVNVILGRIFIDLSLGGTEPMTGWFMASSTTRDGGETWSEPGPEIRLFPHWTEMYGASNPHPLSDGRLMWATMGTLGRDEGWHSGVTFSDGRGERFEPPDDHRRRSRASTTATSTWCDCPTAASSPWSGSTRPSRASFSHSSDEGRTWTPIRPTPFKGSNVKLFRLRSGTVVCAYRDENPARRGVSISATDDGGETWRDLGQLYAAGAEAQHEPGSVCGYPDMVRLGDGTIGAVLHTYPGPEGIDLHWLKLRDRT